MSVRTKRKLINSAVLQVRVRVQLERQREAGPVIAPRFPGAKQEFWWLVVGDNNDNVLAIKRLTCDSRHQATMTMDLPEKSDQSEFKLSFMCDSYLGCDQEYFFKIRLTGGSGGDDAAMQE